VKRLLVLAAAAIVVASSTGVLVLSARNRSGATGGTMELTERELRLPPRLGDSTAIFLELTWDVPSSGPESEWSPAWLTPEKLSELGFDCRVPAASPEARGHYASQPPVPAYVVLEYEGEAWKRAVRRPDRTTRLFAVDAGRDAGSLRAKYPEPSLHAIARAVIGLRLQERSRRDGAPLPEPRLRGSIEMILPDRIFVPRPHSLALQDLRPAPGDDKGSAREPRFAVKVSWGRDHTPWVEAVRLLPAGSGGEARG